ncbi:MurR/RpiR family transcriptional regulator [Tepidamorphus sp. 3E244]|uniref:MurR/RpiR family transcriptional regulator n=1 Tax=Tepidamorphus sp. 3E244 TaxID=3385498 RepID=UPI0038FC8A3E
MTSKKTIEELLRGKSGELTRSEMQLSHVILQNYPVSGLGSITALAASAGVSTPTVARLVQKLGFAGYPHFQRALREELDQKISSPLTKRETWVGSAPDDHILNRFTKAVIDNIGQSLSGVAIEDFEKACAMLADPKRRVFVVGGRITRTLADYFFLHMQVVRENVVHVASNSNAWPHYLLDLHADDVVVIFDIRRYENSTLKLAELAAERGALIVLFTDQWASPVAQFASVAFRNHIAVPSSWDSNVTTMLLAEIILSDVQERLWATTRERMEALEDMFDRTRFFRKFQ